MSARKNAHKCRKRTIEELRESEESHRQNQEKYKHEIEQVESQILYLEKQYLDETADFGNIVLGWSKKRVCKEIEYAEATKVTADAQATTAEPKGEEIANTAAMVSRKPQKGTAKKTKKSHCESTGPLKVRQRAAA